MPLSVRSRPNLRIDVPRVGRRWRGPSLQAALDGLAKSIGTGRFVAAQTGVLVVWIGINVGIPSWRWDYSQPYPFILLTLFISAQAAYAAPLILLNQNRQADIDRVRTQQDRIAATQTEAGTAYVIAELAALRVAIEKAMTRDVVRQELTPLRVRLEAVSASTPAPIALDR